MPKRKNHAFNVTVLGFLLLITLFVAPNMHGGFFMSSLYNKLTCHFYHANLFHWMCNAMCLWLMRPSPMQILKAFPFAVAAMFFTDIPTVGFSAIIYAYIGMNIVGWKVSLIDWAVFMGANLFSAFMPNVAFGVHLAAFTLGISFDMIYRYITHK